MKPWRQINQHLRTLKAFIPFTLGVVLLPAVCLPPQSELLALTQNDESVALAMDKFSREIISAYERRDTKTLKSFYAKQPGALFFWERKMTYSWDQIDSTIDALVSAVASLKLATDEFRSGGSGSNGWFAATFRAERVTPEGTKFSSEGRWTVVTERINGRWLIVHEHTSFPLTEVAVAPENWMTSNSGQTTNRPTKRVNWKLEKTTGERPSARGGGKMVAVGNQLVVLYGFLECFEQARCEHVYFDDIYALDLSTNRWTKKSPKSDSGALPAKRVFFGAATYQKRNTAVIYGGSEYSVKNLGSIKMYDDMWEYNPQTDTMSERQYKNEGPGPRLGPEIVISEDTLYLFGGYDLGFKAHNDLWSYDLLSNTWQKLKHDDDPQSPSKRYIFRFEVGPSNQDLFIFGGNYRETKTVQRNDLWKYNIPTNTFTELISEKNTNITGRTHGAAAVYNDLFVIALGDIPSGGCRTEQASEQQNPTKEVWSVRVAGDRPFKWSPVQIGTSSPALKRVIYATVKDRLYVTQGFDYRCDDPKTAGPVYNLETYSLPLSQIR